MNTKWVQQEFIYGYASEIGQTLAGWLNSLEKDHLVISVHLITLGNTNTTLALANIVSLKDDDLEEPTPWCQEGLPLGGA